MATNEPLGQMIIEMDISSVGFESSLKDMQRALKRNQQQMKAQMAVYDQMEDRIGKLTANHDGLKDAMKLNEQQINKLRQAYRDEVAASGESSAKAQELAREVSKAVQEQAKYQMQLQRVTQQLQDAQDGTKELRDEISLLSAENRSIVASFRAQGKELEALQADYNGLEQAVNTRNQLIDKEKEKLQRLKEQYGEQSDEYRRQVIRIRELETSNEQARQAMNRLEGEMNELGNSSNQLGQRLNTVGDKMKDVGQKATVATAGITGFGIAASKVAKDSDDAFTKMQNAMGLTEKQTEILKKKARDIYKDGYGESLQEVTDAITEVRTNLSELSSKDLKFATKATMNLATTYDADANEITRGANGVMTSFNLSTKKTYDLLAKAAQNGGNKSKEMFDNLAEYAVNFEGAGFSAQEMMNILTNGIQNGYNFDRLNDTMLEFKLKAEDGGKSYEEMLDSLGDTNPITKAYQEYQKGKISIADYYKVVQDNLKSVKKELTTQEYELLGKELFGTKWEDQGAKVVESMKTVNKEMENVDGTMGEINKNVEESFGQRFRAFLNSAKDSLQPLGESLLNIGEKYIPPLIDKITALSQWFESLSTTQQKTVLTIAGIVAAIGPATLIIGSMISVVTKVVSALKTFWMYAKLAGTAVKLFMGPVGWAITGITLLSSALVYAYKHSETFRNFVNKLRDGLLAAWEKMKSMNVSAVVKKMWTSVKNWFANGYNTVKAKMAALGAAIKAIWDAIKAKSLSLVKAMWQSVKDFFAGGYNAVKNKMVAVKTTMGNIWDSIKKLVKDKVGNMIDNVKKMPGKMADGVAKGAGALKKGGKTLLNGLISGVEWGLNKVIKGANKVLGFFGSSKKIDTVNLSKYAKGTPQGGHKGGLAMVNDAPGSKYRELVSLPNGQSFIPKERNVVMNLPKGASVLNGKKTDEAIKGGMIPKYANGTGWLESAFTWAKNKMAKVKNWSSDIWDIATDPDKMKEVLANFVNTALPSSLTKGILPDAIGGLVNKAMDAAKDFLFGEKEALFSSSSGGDFGSYKPFTGDFNKISNKMGVYDFLYDLGKQIVSKFKDTYSGLYISSGKRKTSANTGGVVSDHTTGLGLDLARGGVRDNSYYVMAKSLQNHPYLKMVIGSNMWSKNGSAFSKYPYAASSPHDNHLHLSAKSPSEAKKSSGGGTSAGVEQWKDIATKALRMTGDYSAANLKALLYQMQTESNGNSKAINLWDSNAKRGIPSKGLMQVIDPTFKAYAMKGYNKNIYDPLSNILASIRYTKSRYGSLLNGWRGKGYENGGLITSQHLAMVGEGNKPEMVIPLSRDKRGRAMQLLAQAGQYMGMDSSTTSASTVDELLQVVKLLASQGENMQKQINSIIQLVANGMSVNIDGREVAKVVNKINKIDERRSSRAKGLTT